MKKGTIKQINANGTWKDLFKFEYEMEFTDDTGKVMTENGGALHKTKDSPYHTGQIIEYEITQNDKGFWNIKFQNDKPVFASKSNYVPKDPAEEAKIQLMIVRQSSLKASVDLICHNQLQFEQILVAAEIFTEYATGQLKAAKWSDIRTNEPPF